MLAGIANYIFKILALKSGILPIYKTVSRFMLFSDIVKGIKLSQIIPNFYKPKFIRQQTKFFFLYNFRYTRMFMNIKNHGSNEMRVRTVAQLKLRFSNMSVTHWKINEGIRIYKQAKICQDGRSNDANRIFENWRYTTYITDL